LLRPVSSRLASKSGRVSSTTATALAPQIQPDEEFANELLGRMHSAGLLEPTRSTAGRRRPSYRLSVRTAAALRPALQYITIDPDGPKRGPLVEYVATPKIDEVDM